MTFLAVNAFNCQNEINALPNQFFRFSSFTIFTHCFQQCSELFSQSSPTLLSPASFTSFVIWNCAIPAALVHASQFFHPFVLLTQPFLVQSPSTFLIYQALPTFSHSQVTRRWKIGGERVTFGHDENAKPKDRVTSKGEHEHVKL